MGMDKSRLIWLMDNLLAVIYVISVLNCCESESRAYHKVHNLALFPERHSWCQATPIKQEIASHDPECKPTTIDNLVCIGACFSYAVPRAQDDAVIEPYCDACRPTRTTWTVISLNCTKELTGEHYFLPKSVEMIGNCSCVDCNGVPREEDENETETEDSSGDSGEELDSHSISKETMFSRFNHAKTADENTEDEAIDQDGDDDGNDDQVDEGEDQPEKDVDFDLDVDVAGKDSSDKGSGPTLHKLRSASAEQHGISKAVEDLMIKDNKVSPDDDDDDVNSIKQIPHSHHEHGHGHRMHQHGRQ